MNRFAFYVGLGAAIGLWQVARRSPVKEQARRIAASWMVLVTSLAGARIGFVAFHFSYYQHHLGEAFALWMGGLSWPGAVLGSLAGLWLVGRLWKLPFAHAADELVPLVLPLAAGCWLGCWEAGCAYGPLAPQGAWWGVSLPDEMGMFLPRFPLQGAAVFFLLVFLLWIEIRPPAFTRPGQYASLSSLSVLAISLAASFLQADPAPRWAGLRPDSWASLAFIVLALVAAWKSGLLKIIRILSPM